MNVCMHSSNTKHKVFMRKQLYKQASTNVTVYFWLLIMGTRNCNCLLEHVPTTFFFCCIIHILQKTKWIDRRMQISLYRQRRAGRTAWFSYQICHLLTCMTIKEWTSKIIYTCLTVARYTVYRHFHHLENLRCSILGIQESSGTSTKQFTYIHTYCTIHTQFNYCCQTWLGCCE